MLNGLIDSCSRPLAQHVALSRGWMASRGQDTGHLPLQLRGTAFSHVHCIAFSGRIYAAHGCWKYLCWMIEANCLLPPLFPPCYTARCQWYIENPVVRARTLHPWSIKYGRALQGLSGVARSWLRKIRLLGFFFSAALMPNDASLSPSPPPASPRPKKPSKGVHHVHRSPPCCPVYTRHRGEREGTDSLFNCRAVLAQTIAGL